MILTLVEKNLDGSAVEVSLEALTFARNLSAAGGGVPVDAVVVGDGGVRRAAQGARGVRRPHGLRRRRRRLSRRTPGPAGPRRSCRVREQSKAVVVMAAGTDRGNELMAHVAARAGVAMAANVLSFDGPLAVRGDPPGRRWRGARGDAARPAAGGVLGGRPRGRGDAGGRSGRRRRRRARARDRRGGPGGAAWCRPSELEADESGSLKSARVVVGRRPRGRRRGRVQGPARS